MLCAVLTVLRSHPPFRVLWTARTISFLGDNLSLVALLLYVADQTGQPLAVAALLVVGDVLPALLGPVAGALADRFDLRRLMIGCELTQVALTVLLALWLPTLAMLLVVVAARALTAQVFAPASRTAIGAVVDPATLPKANAALGLGTNGAETAGPLLAALLLPLLGVRGVLLLDAATFLCSAVLLTRLPATRAADRAHLPGGPDGGESGESGDKPARTGLGRDIRDGLSYLRRAVVPRTVLLGFLGVVACNGIDDVALVFLAKQNLGGGDRSVAALLGAVGIGLLVGYWLLGRPRAAGASMLMVLVVGFAISSVGNLLTGLAWAVVVAFGVQAVRGLGLAAMDVAAATALQRTVPAALQGRVFGAFYGVIGVGAGVAYAGGGLLLTLVGPRWAFVLGGAAGLAVTLVTAALLRGRSAEELVDPAAPH
jgi:MFS family permease